MAQTTTKHTVTNASWTAVATAKTKVLVTSNDILPFFVHVAGSAPAIDAPGFECSRGEPFSAADLDADSNVYVRAKGAPVDVIVIA
ncbi:hypothetical protein [Roseibium album]|uniref:hypothetical protein n=1 Tax=Roseibium album TaxID=311410 RepID=UPI0024908D1A|nr:hypothetical protein [Roseibium album]